VTRKITRAVARIVAGKQNTLYLGNLDAQRDWVYAPKLVEVVWVTSQQDEPDDFVLGTGESHSVREFLSEAFGYVGLNWEDSVKIAPCYFRPTEVNYLLAEPEKARNILDWEPKIKSHELVKIIMDADLESMGLDCPGRGKEIIYKKNEGWHQWGLQIVSMESTQ